MIRTIFLLLFTIFLIPFSLFAQWQKESQVFQWIVKIKTYQYQAQTHNYEFSHFWSAVLIGKNRILTNAHVVMGRESDEPTGYYEVCVSHEFTHIPDCMTEARLIAYDDTLDLALLETKDVISSEIVHMSGIDSLQMGQTTIMYGYPMIGGDTITRTEGKIAGFTTGVYKIDGSIDHGNSWGGAFNTNLQLIGIPFAVSADNGVIGYMIPRVSIAKFLSGKSDGYEWVRTKWSTDFVSMMENRHTTKSWWYLESGGVIQFPNPEKFGLSLKENYVSSQNSHLYGWLFSNANNRINVYISCSQDAGVKNGYEFEQDAIHAKFLSQGLISAGYLGKNNQFYRIERKSISNWSKGSEYSILWFYPRYDACMAEIYPTDPIKDKKSLQQIEAFLSQIRFTWTYHLPVSQKNSFFEIISIPKNSRVSSYLDGSGLPQVQLQFQFPNKNRISEKLQYGTLDTNEEYFIKPFDLISEYTWTLSIAALWHQFREQIENTETKVLQSPNGKSYIFSYYLSSDHQLSINFYYPYRLAGENMYWYWTTKFSGATIDDERLIESWFRMISLPGESPF